MVERWWRDIGKTVATLWRLCVHTVAIAWHFTTMQPHSCHHLMSIREGALLPCPLPDAGDGDGLAGAGIS